MITVITAGPFRTAISTGSMVFSGGEVQVRLTTVDPGWSVHEKDEFKVRADLHNANDIMELLLTVDALRRRFGAKRRIHLVCPYLPYARQDRVMQPGEALSLKVMTDLINNLNFESVTVWDAHSDVSIALLNNVKQVEQSALVPFCFAPDERDNIVLVAPDAGAIKKTLKVAQSFGSQMVRADKKRSTVDGSITGTVVYSEHIGKKDFLIVDDICDGGRTFIELAKVLRPLTDGKIILYVTHGIFSKGLEPLLEVIDEILVANPFPGVDLTNPRIRRVA